ncbi:MAG: sigma-70 family RNA polymerase sigma factor [Pirellulaceae bacterium]|nr:sigma-70 family RNA polymerase sigma factor [Planctomycetales bacterium]
MSERRVNARHDRERADWILAAVERHELDLLRYVASITGRAETAREVVQDTFLRLCQQSPGDLDGRLAEWLFTVARNRALDVKRKERRMSTLTAEQTAGCLDNREAPQSSAETADDLQRVERLVAGLSDNQQEVLRLKFQSGLSYKQIAAVTGLSVSNVGYLLHTAVRSIRDSLMPDDA